MLFYELITVINRSLSDSIDRAFYAIQRDVLCCPANVRQLNSKVMARNKLSIRFTCMLDTAQDNARDTRYVICQLEAGVIACERLYAFYAQN